MRRRSALKWLSAALTAANGLLVGIPTFAFLRRMAAGGSGSGPRRFRLARLDDLPPGMPVRVPVKAEVRDAWTVFPDRTIGAVWLVRETDKETPPPLSRVRALSATCPHLACQADYAAERKRFECPCHQAMFTTSGKRLEAAQTGHRNPSPRDLDELETSLVPDDEGRTWWVEVVWQEYEPGLPVRRPVRGS